MRIHNIKRINLRKGINVRIKKRNKFRIRMKVYSIEKMPWPDRFERGKEDMFKSKLRFQIRHEDFRQRISQVNHAPA